MRQRIYVWLNYFITKKMLSFFLQGLMYVAPLGITIYVIYMAFDFIDGILKPVLKSHLGIKIPGIGLLMMVFMITVLGYVGQTIVAQPIKVLIERLMVKAPILNMVYTSIRDFMEAFVGKEKKFNQPVRVLVNRDPEIERFGFITQNDLSELNIKGKVAVYFPFSYGFNGELFVISVENVKPVDIPAGEMMKFIVSGGVTRV
ncbi:MAG: DUF502 domain-containing protein [Bacteroidota bacterium]|nr:DUF502 domain-containing protein [Bacteroidota bacterium]